MTIERFTAFGEPQAALSPIIPAKAERAFQERSWSAGARALWFVIPAKAEALSNSEAGQPSALDLQELEAAGSLPSQG
jgi:hypothetical protein